MGMLLVAWIHYSLGRSAHVPNPICRGYGKYPAEGLEALFRVYPPGQASHFHRFLDSARVAGHRQGVRLFVLESLSGRHRSYITSKLPKVTPLSLYIDGVKVFSTLCEQLR